MPCEYLYTQCVSGWLVARTAAANSTENEPGKKPYLAAVLGSRIQGILEMFSSCYCLSERSHVIQFVAPFSAPDFFFSKGKSPVHGSLQSV